MSDDIRNDGNQPDASYVNMHDPASPVDPKDWVVAGNVEVEVEDEDAATKMRRALKNKQRQAPVKDKG